MVKGFVNVKQSESILN